MNAVTVEAGLVGGLAFIVAGVGLALLALHFWSAVGFGPLSPSDVMRIIIPSGVAILLGTQIIFAGFFASVLEVRSSRVLMDMPTIGIG